MLHSKLSERPASQHLGTRTPVWASGSLDWQKPFFYTPFARKSQPWAWSVEDGHLPWTVLLAICGGTPLLLVSLPRFRTVHDDLRPAVLHTSLITPGHGVNRLLNAQFNS